MSQVSGKIIVIGNVEVVGSAGTFKKRLLVVETEEQYKQKVPIDFVQDKCDILDKYAIGDNVTVDINIRGNEYNSKYYVSLNGWKIAKTESNSQTKQVSEPTQVDKSDLPF